MTHVINRDTTALQATMDGPVLVHGNKTVVFR